MYKADLAIKWLKTLKQNHKNSLEKDENAGLSIEIQDLNLIEVVWGDLKQTVHAKKHKVKSSAWNIKQWFVNVGHIYT